ncbi:CFF_collapsed_G0040200.mRNA.1.CDS.1 [Saccharomyces cerevisiae]|nr:CFF_collapsed_G0040200.mRNA.1.CDS.1 [Saccharomyces cerevisiae]
MYKKFLTFVEDGTRFPGQTNPFKVSYSQENQLDGLHVVSQVHTFEIQVERDYDTLSFTSTEDTIMS